MNLEQAVAMAPYMQDFYDEDITVVISSPQRVIVVINYKNLKIIVSQDEPTNENTVTFRCLMEKKRIVLRVPIEKSQYGISYIVIANPLWNNGELEGVMTLVISDKRYDDLKCLNVSIDAERVGYKGKSCALVSDQVAKLNESEKQSDLASYEDVIEVNVSEQFN